MYGAFSYLSYMGFGGAEVGDVLKSSFGSGNASHKKGVQF